MRLLLLQSQVWVPSLGGGNKANRLLLEALAERGHHCTALCRSTTTRAGPGSESELAAELGRRGLAFESGRPGTYRFRHRDVDVVATDFSTPGSIADRVRELAREIRPDWVLVTDDRKREMLEGALLAAPDRVVLLLQTLVQLPFGPLAAEKSRAQAELFRRAAALVVISRFARDYVEEHSGIEAHLVSLPVYGPGPFPCVADFERGFLTLVNPCTEKGLPIFLELARARPDLEFAAVPTWGADRATLEALEGLDNVEILQPQDDVGPILARTRLLLAPSLWPETFGYVVVEAMLRGIPVLASDVGGLREAKLGVEYLLPVRPAELHHGEWQSPPQDLEPWSRAIDELLTDRGRYRDCSQRSRDAAHRFVSTVDVAQMESLLEEIGAER